MHTFQRFSEISGLWKACGIFTMLLFAPFFLIAQITAGQVDDFNDGTFQNWEQGAGSQGLSSVSNQLQIQADGGGQNGRLVAFNSIQWAGDYISAGVEIITMKVNNTSATATLNVRLSFGSQRSANGGTWFTTSDVATIAAGSGQQEVTFSLAEADMTFVRGTNNYSSLFSNVAYIRIINSATANSNKGDNVVGTLLVDDVTALTSSTTAAYDETADGDISDDRLDPTIITVDNGSNTVTGCVQGNSQPGGRDIDYFTFEVPTGSELTAINLDNYDAAPNNLAFIGIQSGNTFTEPASGTNVSNLLGGLTYGENNENTDILPTMGTSLGGAIGFVSPLPAGSYTIWMNQTGPQSCYTLDLVIAPIEDNCFNDRIFSDVLYSNISSGTYKAANTISTSGTIALAANATVIFEAGQSITLSEGFTASGASFTARIAACSVSLETPAVESRTANGASLENEVSNITIYPNPTRTSSIIEYELPTAQEVSINAFDLSGSLVKTFAQGALQNSGKHIVTVDVSNWNAGMYYVVVQTGRKQLVQKLSIID